MTTMDPDERAFRAHLDAPAFQSGADAGRWRLVSVSWPHAVIAISAAEREGSPSEFLLNFELTGYPGAGPKATPWDAEQGSMLAIEKWPKGERVAVAFRHGWRTDALYIPCDREALAAHADWKQKYVRTAWNETREISHYLRTVHELLNEDDYQGI